jgi:protein O-mannosyl-transferase
LERWNNWIAEHARWTGGLLALLTLAVYSGSLSCQFVFDDIPQILQNPFITNATLWRKIFIGSVWSFRGAAEHDNFYRPLQFVIYWVLYRANGANPAVFHLFQLLLCAGTTWLVFELACELLGTNLAAVGGALLWALHPQHVETIAWVSALPDAGAALFEILGFLFFIRAEKSNHASLGRYGLAALAYFPALLFKESALALPLVVIVYWFFFPGESNWKQKVIRWMPFGGALAVYLSLRVAVLGGFSRAPQTFKDFREVLAAAAGLLGQHARLFLWPIPISAFRVFDLRASLQPPWPWLVLLTLLIVFLFRNRDPQLGFLVCWWLVTLAPCLDFRMVSFPVADRFSYLPSVGGALAVAHLLLQVMPQRIPMRQLAPVLMGVIAIASIAYAADDVHLVPAWGDNVALWDYSLLAAPNSALVHLFQATLLRTRDGNMKGAEAEYRTALRLNRESSKPLAGIAYECYLGLGQVALQRASISEAIDDYKEAIQISPDHNPAFKALGAVYFPQGDYKRAAEYFHTAVKLDPQDVESRFFLGTCELKLGDPRDAAAQFHAARQVDPTYIEAYQAEARALDAAGDAEGAARVRLLASKR